ncbi:glucanase B [Truncatella angustata]|uniref:Glucanase B n=1 Tax=Truncatella angustata TaxID=152316 RepID=A0A9P8RLQ1_9PEZI|nr:glucanase B [Truncatella angustata]KAH6645535.1 glucanase B [Truncatella angustata]
MPHPDESCFQFVNNYNGSDIYAYVTGTDGQGNLVLLTTAGIWYYPDTLNRTAITKIDSTTIAIPILGKVNGMHSTQITIPGYISAGRVWVSEGELEFFAVESANGTITLKEPSASDLEDASAQVDWGFLELTYTEEGGLYANLSFVDFVGLVLSMVLTLDNGEVQVVKGVVDNAIMEVCAALQTQTNLDGMPWDQMCVYSENGLPVRVLAPNLFESINPGSMEGYYTDYVDHVWKLYATEDLTFNPGTNQSIKCRVGDDYELSCDGDNRSYCRPQTADIWSCSTGPFAILESDNNVHCAVVPRLCAAFTRTTLLLDGGGTQPSLTNTSYYLRTPTNHYSRIVHENEVDGKGYAFSYDDVSSGQENVAGVVAGANPRSLEIVIGGYWGD